MKLTLSNVITVSSADDTADLTIIYGTTVETYRRVPFADLVATVNARSALV